MKSNYDAVLCRLRHETNLGCENCIQVKKCFEFKAKHHGLNPMDYDNKYNPQMKKNEKESED